MRKNISSVKTKQRMAKALESLLSTKSIEKITVSDITDICEMNRQTFYYHFHDIYDLTKWLFAGYAEKYVGPDADHENWHEAFLATARFIKQKKKMLISIVRSAGNYFLTDFIASSVKPYVKEHVLNKTEKKNVPERYTEFLSDFYTVSISGLLIEWIATDADVTTSPEELLNLLNITVEGNTEAAVSRYMASSDQDVKK